MRYTVDVAEVRGAVAHLVRAAGIRWGVGRQLEAAAGGLPRGRTSFALPGIVASWRARERQFVAAVTAEATRLDAAATAYEQVDVTATAVLESRS